MRIVFLGASLPLTKTIVYRDGQYSVAPYPHVSKLTSYQEDVYTLQQFETALRRHASAAHCLFNGQLQQPLVNESRRGQTLKGAKREWVVFDFDKIDATDHHDVVKRFLPPECQTVSYIVQHSASMFREGVTQWSGHLFFMLKESSTETALRSWFESLNFSLPSLNEALSLTDSGIALHWPLDRSAAYDSKLIYIAPPRVHGFTPVLKSEDAIRLIKKKQAVLKIGAHRTVTKSEINDRINTLRKDIGLDAKDFKTRPFEDGEVLIETEPGAITDIKNMGEHYIKFNLNGGDSMGYWIDLKNPSVIKNFKGEPWLLTKQVDEKFYKQLSKVAARVIARPPLNEGAEVLAFYATNQNSKVKVGLLEPAEGRLRLDSSSETAAKSWLAEFGIIQYTLLPHIDITFDPTTDVQYVHGGTFLNTFSKTPYMKQSKSIEKPSSVNEIPPLLARLMHSILGDPTPAIYGHFINWLAHIFQTREKAETAWVLTGRTGTGKGTFVRYVLRPLFGSSNVQNVQFTALANEFNGYLESSLFVVFEECDTKAVSNTAELSAKLRHIITDSPILIRKMHTDHYSAPNFSNFLFFANERAPVVITGDDRRYNITERQEKQIFFTPNEILQLKSASLLQTFADVLQRWPVDTAAVRHVIKTQARQDMHEATTPINQQVAEAILAGDLQFFLDRTPSQAEAMSDFHNGFNPVSMFTKNIDLYVDAAAKNEPVLLQDHDLFILFRTLIPDVRYYQDSKTWRRRHHKSLGLDIDKTNRIPGSWDKKARGVMVTWKLPEGMKPLTAKKRKQDEPTNNVIDLPPARRVK